MVRWFLLFAALSILPLPARAQYNPPGRRYDGSILNQNGNPVPGANVRICQMPASNQPCTPLQNVFGDAYLTVPQANPITTDMVGNFYFYVTPGIYELEFSGVGILPKQIPDVCIGCAAGISSPHDLLSVTHLDTIPASPPTRGDIITAQNLTSPASVIPSWARLPLGATTYVLTSNGTDAVWAPASSGSGCTLPGTDTGVLSEHPVGTCYDSADFTWDDGASKQNMQAGLGNVVNAASGLSFTEGATNTADCTDCGILGGGYNNEISDDQFGVYVVGDTNVILGNGSGSGGFSSSAFMGSGNSAQSNREQTNIFLMGFGHTLTGTTGEITDVEILGGFDIITNANGEMNCIHAIGSADTFESSASFNLFTSSVVGNNNTVTAIGGDIDTAGILGTGNTVGPTITNGFAFGANNTVTNCTDCFAIGENASVTGQADYVSIGVSAAPELEVTTSNVRRQPVAFASLPVCAAGTEGSYASVTNSTTAVQGATITGGGTNHVLGYCNATNWIVVSGSGSGSWLSGMTAGQVPIAATATTVTSSKAIQGTDTNLLSSGTVSGTGASLCTDANGGATTSGCSGGTVTHGISFSIGDPAGSTLTVASTTTDYITVPFGCTIQAYNLLIDAGTITVKFWKIATGTAIPTVSNSISTSGVSISSGTAIHSATLTDFTTTTISANDIIAMNVTAVATAKFVNGVLQCQ